ncbi:hypothetical protein C8J56DRAFT_523030 [Mycena floridula]|nr:hypothetical protein C8J56DRAFT_523030 [Mycena floridula]
MRPVSLLALSIFGSPAFAVLTNRTVDDAFGGDSQVGLTYSPDRPGAWISGGSCATCSHGLADPDAGQAFGGTWHDDTQDSDLDPDQSFLEISFEGTAVYVFCIIANNLGDGVGTKADYSFTLDGATSNPSFLHTSDGTATQYFYNVLVHSSTGLSNGRHTLRVTINGGAGVSGSSLILFDYAVITFDDGTAAPTSSTAIKVTTAATSPTSTATSTSTTPASSSSLSSNTPTTSGVKTSQQTGPSSFATNQLTIGTLPSPDSTSAPSSTSPSPTSSPVSSSTNVGAIAGGVVGGIAALLALTIAFLFCWRRRQTEPIPLTPFQPMTNTGSQPLMNSGSYQGVNTASYHDFPDPYHDQPSVPASASTTSRNVPVMAPLGAASALPLGVSSLHSSNPSLSQSQSTNPSIPHSQSSNPLPPLAPLRLSTVQWNGPNSDPEALSDVSTRKAELSSETSSRPTRSDTSSRPSRSTGTSSRPSRSRPSHRSDRSSGTTGAVHELLRSLRGEVAALRNQQRELLELREPPPGYTQ